MSRPRSTSSIAPFLVARPHDDDEHGLRTGRLELLVLLHVVGLLVFTTWDFAGETDFAHRFITWWGTLAVPLAVLACLRRMERRDGLPASLQWLWPLFAFASLVLLSTLNPSFTYTFVGRSHALVYGGARPHWPSSAIPRVSLQALWEFGVIYVSCFNLVIAVVRRRTLRILLYVLTGNALVLAVLGTFQKLAGAPGLYFGLQVSPNAQFFSTFIYHNHWGAFVTLSVAAALGLLFHHTRRAHRGNERHSPVFLGVVATLFAAASVPLSTSRSGSLLVATLLIGALVQWLLLVWRERRAEGRSAAGPMALVIVTFTLAVVGIYLLGQPLIDRRVETTRRQIDEIRLRGNLGNRTQLYADTWRMAREKLWFGWGLGTYGTAFQLFNEQVSVEGWIPFYREAHSDWLQALAEVGMAGTALLVLMGAVPLAAAFRHGRPGVVPSYLLAGCGLIIIYAWIEFPFANPAVLETFWCCLFTAVRYHKLNVANS